MKQGIRWLSILLLGFSSGLPLVLTASTLQAWLTEAKVDLKTIGFASLIGLPYTLKFLWAPLMDRIVPPFLGRRRGWMLMTQLSVAAAIWSMSYFDPVQSLTKLVAMAVAVAFFSASQDIVLDAHRRDTLLSHELGFGSALFVNGYRLGMLFSGAFALYLADNMSWPAVYRILSVGIGVGVLATLLSVEPRESRAPPSLQQAVVAPFLDYFSRNRAWIGLLFLLLYKLGDGVATNMTTPFYLQIGFTKTEIAAVAKTVGLGAMIVGGLTGGALMLRLGLARALVIFGIFQAISISTFALLTITGPQVSALAWIVGFENFCSGLGTTAFLGFLASICDRRFSATQYALFSSFVSVPRAFIAAPAGIFVTGLGWAKFFLFCTLIALPGLFLVPLVTPLIREEKEGHSA